LNRLDAAVENSGDHEPAHLAVTLAVDRNALASGKLLTGGSESPLVPPALLLTIAVSPSITDCDARSSTWSAAARLV
jgi:hypothetical protein